MRTGKRRPDTGDALAPLPAAVTARTRECCARDTESVDADPEACDGGGSAGAPVVMPSRPSLALPGRAVDGGGSARPSCGAVEDS